MKSDHIKDVQREFNVVFSVPPESSANAGVGFGRIASTWHKVIRNKSVFSYGLVFLALMSVSILLIR